MPSTTQVSNPEDGMTVTTRGIRVPDKHSDSWQLLTGACSALEDLHQPGSSVEAHKQLTGAQVGGGDGGDVVQHVQLMHVLEGDLLPQLQVDEVERLLGGQLVLTQQLHQEGGQTCRQQVG